MDAISFVFGEKTSSLRVRTVKVGKYMILYRIDIEFVKISITKSLLFKSDWKVYHTDVTIKQCLYIQICYDFCCLNKGSNSWCTNQ